MHPDIKESDWKIFRQLHPIALERFCERVLTKVNGITSDVTRTSRERYGNVYELIKRRDKELATLFSDLRRSTALMQLALIEARDLLRAEELSRFSPDAREVLARFKALALSSDDD